MLGVYLPGGRRVEVREVDVPAVGSGEVLIQMGASTICGSDIRAIYREHIGVGAEAYRGVIAGHEPSGRVVDVGPGCRRIRTGDRVLLYHIAGCGRCSDCRSGYMIGCTGEARAAYGWQRDGGHAEFIVAAESTCIPLPAPLTYLDGANVACGFGTAYEALCRAGVSGRDAVLITGLGPVGLAAGMLARALGAVLIVGVDVSESRRRLAEGLGVVDRALAADDPAGEVLEMTAGYGCEVAVDCSGTLQGRLTAIGGARRWGRVVLVGEGGRLELDVSPLLIHPQLTLIGSWVTSLPRMEELVDRLVRWGLHPERIVTHRFTLAEAAEAYAVADRGEAGKVALVGADT